MEDFNAEFEKLFEAEEKQKPIQAQIQEKQQALEDLYASGQGADYAEYKRKESQRSDLLGEIASLSAQIRSDPDIGEAAKALWKRYAAAYNEEFKRKYSAYLEAKKALAAQLRDLLEDQGTAINRHSQCQRILDNGKPDFYNYFIAAQEFDLPAPSCLPESMINEVKALADTGFLPIEKRLGYTMILRKQPTSEADLDLRYEDLPPILQAGLFRAINK